VRRREARKQLPAWEPDPRTVRLIEWAIAEAPETEPLPEGAAEILQARRRVDLFEAWAGVHDFGAPAAESLRQAYGLPEQLVRQPEGIVTQVGSYDLVDGIAAMMLQEPSDDGEHWGEREWPTREELRDFLYRQARNILWKRMREEDQNNSLIIAHCEMMKAAPRLARMQFLDDVEKCLGPMRKREPELYRLLKNYAASADDGHAEVDRTLVARRYRVPEERLDGLLRSLEHRYGAKLDELWQRLGGYTLKRKVEHDYRGNRYFAPERKKLI